MVSVKHLPLTRAKALAVLQMVFGSRFLVRQEGEAPARGSPDSGATQVQDYFLALPPQHHLLLRCEVHADGTSIMAATDAWQTLSYLEDKLDEEVKAQGDEPTF